MIDEWTHNHQGKKQRSGQTVARLFLIGTPLEITIYNVRIPMSAEICYSDSTPIGQDATITGS